MKQIGILELLTGRVKTAGERAVHFLLKKQFISITPQAISDADMKRLSKVVAKGGE